MSRRFRKSFPPGTFIPTPQRLLAILQLCLAFSLLLWYMTQPFMGEYFALRSRMLLYEYVMGTSDILRSRPGQEAKLERQAQRFQQLPESERFFIKKDYQKLQNYAQRPMLQKIGDGMRVLIRDIPLFEQAWLFFSILLAILILLKVEGAKQAAWLLPLIVLAYVVDNQLVGKPAIPSPDNPLFPTEEVIIHRYLSAPLASHPLEQKKQLEEGWHHYLVAQWPSEGVYALENAEFHFTIARLHLLHDQPRAEWLRPFHEKLGWPSLTFYLLWNVFFAWRMFPPSLSQKPQPPDVFGLTSYRQEN